MATPEAPSIPSHIAPNTAARKKIIPIVAPMPLMRTVSCGFAWLCTEYFVKAGFSVVPAI
jgi:hypothetical protein